MIRWALASALVLARAVAADAAAPVPTQLSDALLNRDWPRGVALCAALPASEARWPDRQRSAAHFAGLAATCAALASGAGDRDGAEWWWFMALALHQKTAVARLPALRESGLLQDLPEPRPVARRGPSKVRADGQVLLPSGELVAGVAAIVTYHPELPRFLPTRAPGVARIDVKVEVLVEEDGVPRQPLLVTTNVPPLQTFLILDYFRTWRFAAAKVGDRPAVSVSQLRLSISHQPG